MSRQLSHLEISGECVSQASPTPEVTSMSPGHVLETRRVKYAEYSHQDLGGCLLKGYEPGPRGDRPQAVDTQGRQLGKLQFKAKAEV